MIIHENLDFLKEKFYWHKLIMNTRRKKIRKKRKLKKNYLVLKNFIYIFIINIYLQHNHELQMLLAEISTSELWVLNFELYLGDCSRFMFCIISQFTPLQCIYLQL